MILIGGKRNLEKIRDNTLKTVWFDYQVDITPADLTRLVLCTLAENTSVDTLEFGHCELNDTHIEALVAALVKDGRTVDTLYVSDNNITDKGLLMIMNASNIKIIGCGCNNITDRVVPAVLARECDRIVGLSGNYVSEENLEKLINISKEEEARMSLVKVMKIDLSMRSQKK